MTANEDFLFAQEAIAQGFVTDAQVEEGLLLQKRMADDLKLDERLGVILVKRGYLAEDQARRVYARIEPEKTGEIRGYKLLSVIGRGAMGTVYRALNVGLNREVAIKVLRPDLAGDRTQVERLRAEAKMLADLDHPNVIRALDAGESNGFPFVVMEYVEGETLRDKLRREGPLPEAEALRITRCLADALERARRMGIVHRDVKPGNVLLARNGTPKLMDLGLAKGPIDLGLTQHGATVGTPQYISPEQAVDPRKADTRSDIYSLGATLYAMLTGKPPFDGQTLAEILTKVLYETPVPVRTLRPEVSPEAGYLVERMMLRDPSLRYRTPLAVVEDLDRLQQGTSILPTGFSGNWEAYLLRQRSRRWLGVGAKTLAAAAVVAVSAHFVLGWIEAKDTAAAWAGRIDRVLGDTPILPTDDLGSIGVKLRRVRSLEKELGGAQAQNRSDLAGRLEELRVDVEKMRAYEDKYAREVLPALRVRHFADAERLLVAFLAANPGFDPVRHAVDERLAQVRGDSDKALAALHAEWAAKEPKTFADVVRLADEWADLTHGSFADTAETRRARSDAADDVAGAKAIALAVRRGADDVAPGRMRETLGLRRFDEARKRLTDARKSIEDELDRREARLKRLADAFGKERLRDLALAPLVEAEQEADRMANEAGERAIEDALALSAARRYDEARQGLKAFVEAAGSAFQVAAESVRERSHRIEEEAQQARETAEGRWASLLASVVDAIRAQDADAAEARVAAARATNEFEPFPSLAGQFAALSREIDAYRAFWISVFEGLDRRTGPAPAKWIKTIEMADSTVERMWEVVSVDRAARKVVIRRHSGGTDQQQTETRDIGRISRAQLVVLAGLDPESKPADAFPLAMFELAGLPDPAAQPDFYARLESLESLTERFERGGDKDAPLSGSVRASRDRVKGEASDNEALAEKSLKTAMRCLAEGQYSEARHYFWDLRSPPLVYTRAYREAQSKIAKGLSDIDTVFVKNDLEKVIVGVHVTPRQGTIHDVDLGLDLNTVEQGGNFVAGLARFVPAPTETRTVTPTPTENLALRILPDDEGRLVTNRPLSIEDPFDPAAEMSVAFDLHLHGHAPFFLGIDLDGDQVGVLSADPKDFPFTTDAPRAPKEKKRPELDFYGRGRGVLFHAADDRTKDPRGMGAFGDPARWRWDDAYYGRHFVDHERDVKERDPQSPLLHRFFAFVSRERPYRVKLARQGDTLRLEVDGQTVVQEKAAEFASPKPSGLIQILSFTTCEIDNLVLSGRVRKAWLDAKLADLERRTVK